MTNKLNHVIIRTCPVLIRYKNLLPKIVSERDALNCKLSKIKRRFLSKFTKLAIILFFSLSLLGYYPTFAVPLVRHSVAKASSDEQKGEIIANKFSKPLILPHPGYLSTKFSSYHPGIDIAIGLGMPIHPIIDGEIIQVSRDFWGLGNFVEVSHQNGFKSKYGHMGKIFVKVGDQVTQENILGEVGLTGHTSGPHTHLEVTLNGNYIDPAGLLPEIPNMPIVASTK